MQRTGNEPAGQIVEEVSTDGRVRADARQPRVDEPAAVMVDGSIGSAIDTLRAGGRVSRRGKAWYLNLIPGGQERVGAFLIDGGLIGDWMPTAADVLATDWYRLS